MFLSNDDGKKATVEKEIPRRCEGGGTGRPDPEVVLVVGADVADEGSVEGFGKLPPPFS